MTDFNLSTSLGLRRDKDRIAKQHQLLQVTADRVKKHLNILRLISFPPGLTEELQLKEYLLFLTWCTDAKVEWRVDDRVRGHRRQPLQVGGQLGHLLGHLLLQLLGHRRHVLLHVREVLQVLEHRRHCGRRVGLIYSV